MPITIPKREVELRDYANLVAGKLEGAPTSWGFANLAAVQPLIAAGGGVREGDAEC